MMSAEKAKRYAEHNYPQGPEKLAEKLGIAVEYGPLSGCDGWVLSGPAMTLIRINAQSSPARQRFTLAHELGHLLLGVPTVVGETVDESLRSNRAEERQVNDLASELLLPKSKVQEAFPSVPVVATQLRRLAKQAKVSELVVANRVVNLAEEIGLVNATVVYFQNDAFEWQWSKTLKLPVKLAVSTLQIAREAAPNAVRISLPNHHEVVVASMIENPTINTATLFIQLLPEDVGEQLSLAETKAAMEDFLFENDPSFRPSLQGCMSTMKTRWAGKPLEEALADFQTRYATKWTPQRAKKLNSTKGRAYIRLRLQEWCSE